MVCRVSTPRASLRKSQQARLGSGNALVPSLLQLRTSGGEGDASPAALPVCVALPVSSAAAHQGKLENAH